MTHTIQWHWLDPDQMSLWLVWWFVTAIQGLLVFTSMMRG